MSQTNPGQHLLSLINDILDLSKIDAGHLELIDADFSLRTLFESCTTIVSPGAQEKGLSVFCDIDPSADVNAVGDQARLRQVLINLLGNAVKFTEAGYVSLSARAEPIPNFQANGQQNRQRLTIRISDTGIGIEPELQQGLFQGLSPSGQLFHAEIWWVRPWPRHLKTPYKCDGWRDRCG